VVLSTTRHPLFSSIEHVTLQVSEFMSERQRLEYRW
jgi:hypothetical protein